MIDAPPVITMTPIEQAEAFVAATGAQIDHGGTHAFYRPSTDSIQLPPREAFIGSPTRSPAESVMNLSIGVRQSPEVTTVSRMRRQSVRKVRGKCFDAARAVPIKSFIRGARCIA